MGHILLWEKILYYDCLREVGTQFSSSHSIGEKVAVATVVGGWGSLGRTFDNYFTGQSLQNDLIDIVQNR